jgi:lycopene cyclase domain-containing protein
MPLYASILICTLAVPLALSFETKLQFYRQWKFLLPSISVVAAIYIGFDILFTGLGVWGFNPRYHSNIILLHLPLEEWLFFIIVPYASIFIHDTIVLYFAKLRLTNRITHAITIVILIGSGMLVAFNTEKIYTSYIFGLILLVLPWSFFDKTGVLNTFYITFLVILLPFIAVNAVLTGSLIEEPIVWYNNSENLGIRFLTIPVEDFGYAFSLILFILLIRSRMNASLKKHTMTKKIPD